MNIKSLLFRALLVVLVISLPAAAAAEKPDTTANSNPPDVKTAILDGYLQRCVEVLHSKGYSSEEIKEECSCELDQIEQNFSIFEQMLTNSKADNQQQINDFKKQLLQCKVKPQASQ